MTSLVKANTNYTVEFHSFHWDNFSPEILKAHSSVMQHLDIPIQYTQKNIPHGQWLDDIMRQATSDVIVIIEPDLFPLNRQIVDDTIQYVLKNDTFLGCAQVSNHIGTASHIFASPAFFAITRTCYEKLGSPSFMPNKQGDVAEALAFAAEAKGIRYRTLFPSRYEKAPSEGCWPLASYGYYGIGTVFEDKVYHLFQSRTAENIELFVKRCHELIQDQLDLSGFKNSINLEIPEHVYQPKKKRKWYSRFF